MGAEGAERPHHQRVAVGRGAGYLLGADAAAGAALIFDHHGLTKAQLQPLRDQPCSGVGRSARRERHDELDGLEWVGLSMGEAGRADRHSRRHDDASADHRYLHFAFAHRMRRFERNRFSSNPPFRSDLFILRVIFSKNRFPTFRDHVGITRYSALMPVTRTISAHLGASSAMIAPNSAGVVI